MEMSNNGNPVSASFNLWGESIYTLVQSGTRKSENKQPLILVKGHGTDIYYSKVLQNRAKRKMITQKAILKLVDMAKERGDKCGEQSLWNTYHCQRRLIISEGKAYGNYCKNRFCLLCSVIRQADIINKYLPILKTWESPHFVTLTIKAVSGALLNETIDKLYKAFTTIIQRCKKSYQRGACTKMVGIKSLECSFNPYSNSYNPHFHIIVSNKIVADILIDGWLRYWSDKCSRKAQYCREIEDREDDLIAIVKYSSKVFSYPEFKKKRKKKVSSEILITAFYAVIVAMKKRRVFDRFGFNLPKKEKKVSREIKVLNSYKKMEYSNQAFDWIDGDNESQFFDYLSSIKLI